MDVRVGLWRKLNTKELMLLNYVLEKTLESPLDCKEIQPVHPKGKQSWIFIGRTDVEAELQNFGHLMQKADSLEKTLMLGKIEGRRRRERQRMRWLDGIPDSMDMSLSKLREVVKDREFHGVAKSQTWISNWITTTKVLFTQLQQLSTHSHSHFVQTPSYFLVHISTGDYFEAIPAIIPLRYNYFLKLQSLNLKNAQKEATFT